MASEAKGLAEAPAEEVKGRRGIKKGLYLHLSAPIKLVRYPRQRSTVISINLHRC